MESMLKKVTELERMFIKATEEQNKLSEVNTKDATDNKELRTKLNAKAKDLKEREEVVKPVEDIASFKALAEKTMRDAKKKMKEALAEQDNADKKNRENAQEHAKQIARIALEDKRILDENAGIKKGYDQLHKAEAESEVKVLKSIVKKAVK